jgi:hypothetical protein
MAEGRAHRLQGAPQAVLAEGLAARRGALEDAVGDEDEELARGDRRGRGLGRRVEPVEPQDRAIAALELAQSALGVPDRGRRVPAAQPGQRRGGPVPAGQDGAHEDVGDLQRTHRVVDARRRVGQVTAAAARRAVGAQRDRADGRGLRSLADGVGHAEPAAVAHRAVVDPVAADVVGRQDRAGQVGALQAGDARRHEVLLELGGGAARAVPARSGQHVGEALGQLEGGGAAGHQRLEVAGRRRGEDQHAERATAQGQRHHRGTVGQARRGRLGVVGGDLRADQLPALKLLGQPAVAGHAAQRAPVEVTDVEGGRRPRDRLRLGHEALGEPGQRGLFEQPQRVDGHGACLAPRRGRRARVPVTRARLQRGLAVGAHRALNVPGGRAGKRRHGRCGA